MVLQFIKLVEFSFEIASMLTDFSYLVGHGLFIKSDISNKYNFCEKL